MDPEENWECLGWINLASDRDKLCCLVNTVINVWVP
jgi:hypothetical protein